MRIPPYLILALATLHAGAQADVAEGLTKMGFAIARVDRLRDCAGNAGSWSFDLSDIYAHSLPSGGGTSRFTPPAQTSVRSPSSSSPATIQPFRSGLNTST